MKKFTIHRSGAISKSPSEIIKSGTFKGEAQKTSRVVVSPKASKHSNTSRHEKQNKAVA
ncbi:MAG: hypothetical protein ACI9WC_002379 [Arenicella sp.]|jgi:hypothetical protein